MKSLKITVSELILSAVYFLQKKNGVSAKDITKYICQKRGLKQSRMKSKVKEALERGTQNGIFNMKRGLYKVQKDYKKKLPHLKNKISKRSRMKTSKRKFMRKKNSRDLPRLEDGKQETMRLTALPISLKKHQKYQLLDSVARLDDEIERNQREGSYFETSMFIEGKDDDDFSSAMANDNNDNCSNSYVHIDKMGIYTARTGKSRGRRYCSCTCGCPRKKRRRTCPRQRCKNKSSICSRSKKRKLKSCRRSKKSEKSLEQRKSGSTSEKNSKQKSEQGSTRQSDVAQEDDSHICSDSEEDKSKEKENNRPTQVVGGKWKARREAREQNNEKKETKSSAGRKDSRGDDENQTKPDGDVKKFERGKSSSSSDLGSDDEAQSATQDTTRKTESKSVKPLKKEVELSSSSELLPSDLKLSLSSNLNVSDVKISPSNLRFEDQESTTILYSEKQKKQQESQQNQKHQKQESLNDVRGYCECKRYRRKNRGLSYRDNQSPAMDEESTQGRLKSKCSRK